MNCSVCGSPLLFDRVVFRCECGAYVHSYCVDKHIVTSHRPVLEEGYADLNGEFHPKYQPVPEPSAVLGAVRSDSEPPSLDEDDEVEEDLIGDEAIETLESHDVSQEQESDDS
ncbi:MAG: hypothetical protein JXA58_05930 [Dehalococcoidia bacterium]|nr:hypothetical protein [Dehalococcoidia bacterium]